MRVKSLSMTVLILLAVQLIVIFTDESKAADYKIDPAHSFVEFRIKHLGFSWLYGRFNKIAGEFSYNAASPDSDKFSVEIETASIDTNHAERDKHLRSKDFLHVNKYPESTFESTKFSGSSKGGVLEGVFTLNGVSKPIKIDVIKIGEGKDPWKGYRAGFEGKTILRLKDFGINYNLGLASETMEINLGIEGIRK